MRDNSRLFFQRIANFSQQLDIFRWCCRCFFNRFFFFCTHLVYGLHHQENDERDDDEIHNRSNKATISEDRALFFRRIQSSGYATDPQYAQKLIGVMSQLRGAAAKVDISRQMLEGL